MAMKPFQSSLEENPEWNPLGVLIPSKYSRFNPHSRKTPSGTFTRATRTRGRRVSILTRGKPRVELAALGGPAGCACFNPHSRKTPSGTERRSMGVVSSRSFNPHSRKTPSGTYIKRAKGYKATVSILTRGKPRVERARATRTCASAGFNPHSRKTPSGTKIGTPQPYSVSSFNPHSRKTPSGTSTNDR